MAALAVQLAFTAAGSAGAFGGGIAALGLSGAGVGSLVGSVVSSFLFPPPDIKNYGPRLTDLSVTSSTYGQTIPICYGTVPVAGNIIDASEIYETAHKETESGGKGGGQEVSYTTYTYSVDLAVALCEGPIDGILQIFANEKLIYDATPESGVLKPDWLDLTIYDGSETQLPDPTLEAIHGAGEVPAYRGLAYIVFPRFELQEFGNRPPTFRIIVVKNGDSTIHENVIDLSATSTTARGPVYSEKTGLLYATITATATATRPTLFAIDPISKRVVWSVPMIDDAGDDMKLAYRPYICSDGTTTYVVSTGRKPTGSGVNSKIAFVDANSGYVYNVSTLLGTAYAHYDSARPLYTDQLVFMKTQYGGFGVDPLAVHTFGIGWTRTANIINPISGWEWNDGNTGIRQGTILAYDYADVIAEISSTSSSDIGLAIWSDAMRVLGSDFTPNAIIINLGSALTGVLGIHWNEYTETFWMRAIYGDDRIEFIEVDLDGDYTVYNWDTLYSISQPFHDDEIEGPEFENGYMWIRADTPDTLYRWDIENLTTPVEFTDTTINRNFHYESITQSMWGANSDDIIEYQYNRLESNTVTLASIVDDLSDRVGIDNGDYDTSEIASINVRGYVIGNIMPARSAIDPLRKAFLFDHADTGAQIEFRPLGQSVVRALTIDDVGAHAYGDSAPPILEISRIQELDLPKELSVNYMDVGANYEIGHQRARIISSRSKQSIRIEMPIVMTHTEAARAADVLIHLAYIEREGYQVQAMPVHNDLIPSNVVNINDGTTVFRMRIQEKMNERGVIKLIGVRDEPAVLTSAVMGGEITGRDATIFIAGIMQFALLNIPPLRDADMVSGFYVAAYSYSDDWPGGVLFRESSEAGFSEVHTIASATTTGRVWDTPEAVIPTVMDTLSTLDITIYSGEISGTTKTALLTSNINAVAYGADGRWEIMQFQDATLEANGHYTVSNLIRGRLGTDAHINTHENGDLFIVLSGVRHVSTNNSDIGTSFNYRGVTIGRSIYDDSNIDVDHGHVGSGLITYSVAHARAVTEPDLDVLITWAPRTRQLPANFWSGIEVDPEEYEIDIYEGSTLERTVTGLTSPTYTYTRTDQESDLGASTTDTVTIKIYHVSAITGRGAVSEITHTLG